jgi:hypothetical protein
MALKDLTTPTMLSVLDTWLDPKRALPKIKSLSRSSALLPDLASVRDGLQDSHAVNDRIAPELQKLQVAAGERDSDHDRKARGLDKIVDGLRELVDDPDLAEKLGALRGQILGPKGLLVISSSFTDEAQNAKLVDKRLTPESKALLAEVTVLDRTLGDWVKDWQRVAKELGKIEAERTALETKAAAAVRPSDAVRARNKAIRTMNAFLSMLDLDDPAEDLRAELLGPLDVALTKAEKRGKRAASPEVPAGTDDESSCV